MAATEGNRPQRLCVRTRVGARWRWNGALLYFLGAQLVLSAGPLFAQAIVPDGRTQTSVSTQGVVSDVRTATVSGANAFNSFQRFGVPSGATANMHLPAGTANLVNIVRDQRTDVYGLLNAIKDGRIGGNVYFANPHGFLVGAGGVVNVGSLTLSTPTQQFVDNFFVAPGTPEAGAVAQLFAGTAPRSGTGAISIQGTINAVDDILLQAGMINVGGRLFSGARFIGAAPDFTDVVNANGLATATTVVAREGRIHIVADGDVAVSGTIAAPGGSGVRGGHISIRVGNDLELGAGTNISARGNGENSSGGSVDLWAGNNAAFRAGATIDARGGASGDGGAIELSAKGKVTLDGGEFLAKANRGRHGTILIDPTAIDATTSGRITDGTPITFSADDSITVESNVVLSSRNVAAGTTDYDTAASEGDSGNITLRAPSIVLKDGSKLLAHADSGFAGGTVTLDASKTATSQILGYQQADTSIQIGNDAGGATIRGDSVVLKAATTIDSKWIYEDANLVSNAENIATALATDAASFFAGLVGVNITHSQAVATASVMVKGGSVIEGRQGVELRAQNTTSAGATPSLGLSGPGTLVKTPLGLGALYARNDSSATVTVESGATIKAANLTVRAHNDAKLEASIAAGESPDTSFVAIAAGVAQADIQARATVAQGAELKVTGAVSVAATNVNSFGNTVKSESAAGKAAAAIAYSDFRTSAVAELKADVPDATKVEVVALSDTTQNVTNASAEAGRELNDAIAAGFQEKLKPLTDTTGAVEDWFWEKLGIKEKQADDKVKPKSTPFRIGGAIAYATSDAQSSASLGAAGSAVNVHGTDSIVVAARTRASDIQISAESAAVSQAKGRALDDTARNTFSAGVAIGDYSHGALAKVEGDTTLTAPRIAVVSDVQIPVRETLITGGSFDRWDGLGTLKSWFSSLSGVFDVFNGSSAAASTSDNSDNAVALSGSVSIIDFTHTARSVVDANATLNLSGSQAGTWNYSFQSVADNPATTDKNEQIQHDFQLAAPAYVHAARDTTLLFHGGQFIPGDSGGGSGSKGLGLAYTQQTVSGTSEAIVREGATIQGVDETASTPDADGLRTWTVDAARATQEVEVSAEGKDLQVSIASAGGYGATFGLNGSASVVMVDNASRALVDNEATVKAQELSVLAQDTPVTWSISGGFNKSEAGGVGIGISYNGVTTSTLAEIADNDAHAGELASRSSAADLIGSVLAKNLEVEARTGGRVEAIAVTGSVAWNNPSQSQDTSSGGFFKSIEHKYNTLQNKLGGLVDLKPGSTEKQSGEAQGTGSQPSFGLSGAGSAAVNDVDLTTRGRVEGVTVSQDLGDAAERSLLVRGVSDLDITTASGAAALTRANNPSQTRSAAIAGSVAVNLIDNVVEGLLKSTPVTGVNAVDVQALAGGEQLSIAIGAAIDASNTQGKTLSLAATGSLSLSFIDNDVRAAMEGGSIAGVAGAAGGDVELTAYNRSFIGTGGGSLALGGKTAAGGAVTYSDISNDVTATITGGATVNGVDTVSVRAYNATEIGAGAAHGAVSNAQNANALGGAVVITEITNFTTASIAGGASVTAAERVEVLAQDRGADAALEQIIEPGSERENVVAGLDYCGASSGVAATPSGNCITSVAGIVQVTPGGGSNNIGLSFNWSQINNEVTAKIEDAAVSAAAPGGAAAAPTAIDVSAESNATITSFAVGVGVADKTSAAGSVAVNRIRNEVLATASSTDATRETLSADTIDIEAKDKSRIDTLAGQVTLSMKGAAIGAAVAYSDIDNDARATVQSVELASRNGARLAAGNDSRIRSLAVAGSVVAGGSQPAVSASIAVNFIGNRTEATSDDAVFDDAAGGAETTALRVEAEDKSQIQSLAGSVALSGTQAAGGGAFGYSDIGNTVLASVEGSQVLRAATLDITAKETGQIQAITAAAAGGQTLAISGSVSLNHIGASAGDGNLVTAELKDSTVGDASTAATLLAEDSSRIESLAGALAISLGAGGVGGAVADNATGNVAKASVSGSTLENAASLSVQAKNTSTIRSLSAAISGAGTGAFSGSASSNRTLNQTVAEIANARMTGAGATVTVDAGDTAKIESLSGAAAFSGSAAFGAAISVNRIANVTEARVTGALPSTQGLQVGELVVKADSLATIDTIAVGGAAAAAVGVAGSVAVNIIESNTDAHISGGAKVEAQGNAAVIAKSDDVITVGAGAVGVGVAGAGVAASVVVNEIGGATRAHISGAATEVTAHAGPGTPALSVASGELTGAVDLADGIDGALDFFTRPDIASLRAAESVQGVAVNASATHHVQDFVVNVGAGTVGVSGVANVSLISGQTLAYIDQARINQANTGTETASQSVHVKASDHAYGSYFVGSASGGVVGAGVVADVHVFDRDTKAYVQSALLDSAGRTDIGATSSQGISTLVVGASGGVVGVVGAGSVAKFTSDTEAYAADSTAAVGSQDVKAQHTTRMFLSGGTASGGGVGVGATFDVGLDNSVTRAHVDRSTLTTSGQVNVDARSASEIREWTVAGTGAGLAAVAGTAGVALIGNTTQAYVIDSSVGSQSSRAAGVSVSALDTVTVQQVAGSAAIAGVAGAGVAAAVTKVENTTSAYIDSSSLYATQDIVVDAQATRDFTTTVVTAGGGVAAGIGGSVGVTLVGTALSSSQDGDTNANKELNSGGAGTLSQVDSFGGGDRLSFGHNMSNASDNGYAGAGLSRQELQEINDRGRLSAATEVYAAATQSPVGEVFDPSTQLAGKTAAIIGGSSVVDAERDVRVHASEKDRIGIVTGGGALGGLAGIGGSVSVAEVTNNVEAAILGTTQLRSGAGKIEVIAEAGKLGPERAILSKAVQAAGGAVALGAAVAVGENTNNVRATLGRGTTTSVGSGLTVRATDTSDVEAQAVGASGGLVAAGIVIARADKLGAAEARASNTGGEGATSVSLGAGTMTVEAERSGATRATTVAGAGGVLAGAGSDARALDQGLAKAYIGDALAFSGASGGLTVSALARPETFARAEGYGGALAAFVGVSIAKSHAQPTVEAFIGQSGITAGNVSVNAVVAQPATWTARSEATAAGGGLLLGLTSTESAASSVSKASAQIRDGAELHVSGSTTVTAGNSADQSAWVSGVSVGGLAAGGEANALATSDSTTVARVDNRVTGEAGALVLRATGDDENYAEAKSGGGAIVAGAAAKARTQGDSNTRGELGGGSGSDDAGALHAKAITLAAQHTARFNSKVDTLVAAVVGGSGGSAYNLVSSRVESTILEDANLRASSLDAAARNIGVKPLLSGYNAEAASGGLFSGAAAGSRSDIGFVTLATVGSDATVRLTGDPDLNPGSIVITASNDLFARDRTKLDTGGAIAVARAQSQIYLNQADANTTVASGADLYSVGDINLSSLTKADIEASANAKTYGLAGAAEGLSEATANSNNLTRVEADAALRAEGHIRVNAGRDENGQANVHRAKARTDLYNKTALPISTDPDANAIIDTANRIEVAEGARVEAVKDIFLAANKGQMSADGRGVGKDLYREVLAAIGSFFSNLFGGGDVSLDIHGGFSSAGGTATVTVEGLVAAGVQHKQRLVIAVDGTITEQTDGVRIRFRGTENLRSNIGARIIELQAIIAQWSGEPEMKDALQAEVARLQAELDRLAPQPFSDAELQNLVTNGTLTQTQADAIRANQRPGGSLEGATLITVTEVENVRARGGDIFVEGDRLGGSGTLKAPGDAEISLINESPQYLRTNKLTIIDDVGGRVRLNGRAISAMGGLTIESSGPVSATPKIQIENSYNPALAGNPGAPAPDIEVHGDITNRFGDAIIKNAKGSIRVEAPPGTTSAPNIIAETIRIEAGRDFVQAYVDGAVSIGGSPEALWNAEATAAQAGKVTVTRNATEACGTVTCKDGKGSVIAGNNVFISARYLNINGTVQSGLPDWQLTIPAVPGILVNAPFANLTQQLSGSGYSGPALTQVGGRTFVPLQALVHARTHGIEVPYEFQKGPRYQLSGFAADPQGTVASFYNAETNRIELDSVRVEGGYMELFGEILNTGGGRIRVMDGFGRINIANNSGFDLQMNGLDAGNVEGKLRITDTARRYLQSTGEILTNPGDAQYLNARPVTTTYTRVGDDVTVAFSSKRTVVAANGVTRDELVDLGSGLFSDQIGVDGSRSGFYDPVAGRKYVWGVGTDFTQAWHFVREQTSLFGIPVAAEAFASAQKVQTGEPRDLTQTRIAWAGAGQATDYQYTFRNVPDTPVTLQWSRNTNWCSFWLFGCIARTYKQEYYWTQGQTEYKVHSVTADKRIPIEFVGYDTGSVSLASAGNVILKSGIRSGNGLASVTSTGGAILSETGQPIIGNGISLEASTGIGSSVAPIEVQLAGGNLRAVTATGNIGVRASGNARIELVSSGTGDIWISGNRSLLGAGSGTHHVNGRMVELHAAESIGTAANALKVQTGGDALQAGLVAGAPDGINIDQPSGDLRLVSVESSGDVHLSTQGDFVDGNLNDQKDTRAIEELQAQWAGMRLLGTAAEQAADETVATYRGERKRQYETYWSYRKTPIYEKGRLTGTTIQAHDPNFAYVVSASERARLQASGLTEAQISAYAATRTAEYHSLHAELATTNDVASYDPNWQPAVSTAKVAELREGAVWTQNQLQYSVARGILSKTVTDTELRIEEANVKGASVTLVSRAGGVGRNLGEQTFTKNDVLNLNPDDRAKLAAAELDDIAMVDGDTLRLTQRDDIDVVASRISIDAKGRVYLGSELNLNIDALKTDDSIRIKGAQSIFRVTTPTDAAAASIRGGSLILEAADGAIGSADNPLTTALKPGATLTARARHDIHVREIEGAMSGVDAFSRFGSIGLEAAGNLSAPRIALPGTLLLAGEDIDANVAYLLPDALTATLRGSRTPAAGSVVLVIEGPSSVTFDRLWAREAVLLLPRGPLQVSDGFIGGNMLVTTPDMRLLMDNRSPALQAGYDVQLFAPGKTFWLYVDGRFVRTRLAHVIYRGEASNPDVSEGLEGAESSVREIARDELGKLGRTIMLPSPRDLLLLPPRRLVDIGAAAPLNLEQ